VQATGGTGARTWSISAGSLPTGLDINQSTGEISGTPTAAGTFNFTVQVQDSGSPQQTDTQDLSILIAEPLAITSNALSNTTEDVAVYSDTVAANGGQPPLTFSVSSGSLPPGLTLDTASGTISGDPTTGGSFNFEIQVTDSLSTPQTDSQAYTVRVLEITTTGLADGVQNDAYNAGLSVVGEVPAVAWSEPAGGLGTGTCAGLALDVNTGVISGTPTNFGTCGPFTINATDSDSPTRTDTQSLSITIAQDLLITTVALPDGTAGVAYNQSITAAGGTSPFTWSEATVPSNLFDSDTGEGALGTACQGLTLDLTSTGIATSVSGTPVNGGTCGPFTVRVDDSGAPAQFDTQNLSIFITPAPLVITTGALPSGAVNRSYNTTLDATGGTPPFDWSEPTASFDDVTGAGAAATPCEGLTLDLTATGSNTTIAGSPTVDGTCGPFTIQVDDAGADSDSGSFSIVVDPEPLGLGRNDTVANATDLGAAPAMGGETRVAASISPFGAVVAGVTPNPADNDFYQLTAPAGATLSIEVVARRLATLSRLDSVIELVTDDSSDLGARILAACRESTPNDFDDNCINDDIVLGNIRDSRLEFQVPSSDPFYIRVLDWRGDARPDLLYELVITRVN
jgi:hypothetical protein